VCACNSSGHNSQCCTIATASPLVMVWVPTELLGTDGHPWHGSPLGQPTVMGALRCSTDGLTVTVTLCLKPSGCFIAVSLFHAALCRRPAARVLSLANKSFSGERPSFLTTQPTSVDHLYSLCNFCRRPAARALSLANNSFSGELPSFLITQPPLVEDACDGCMVRVLINGPDSNLQVSTPSMAC
jgi:hypothetical protein